MSTNGVLNTDNMSVLGLTIDYGPYAFLDHFNPAFISNASDKQGRYRYEAQPEICGWNLTKFAEALDPMVPLNGSLDYIKANYWKVYNEQYNIRMSEKLGLIDSDMEASQL